MIWLDTLPQHLKKLVDGEKNTERGKIGRGEEKIETGEEKIRRWERERGEGKKKN